jgi:hypothetical protein
VLAKEGKKVLLADTELPTEAMNVKFASLDPSANGFARNPHLRTDLFDAEQTLNIGGGSHGFESWLAIGEGD